MDNLTHSFTGALAARLLETQAQPEAETGQRRAVFWLLVLCANLPDIDVLLGLFGDPIFSTKHHRGLTHSVLFAPVMAMLPALLWYRFSKVKRLAPLYLFAVLGILIHIVFDVITSYGTRLLLPFSQTRFAFDWMFIIDPFFTVPLGMLLGFGRLWRERRKAFTFSAAGFVLAYLVMEFMCSHLAHERTQKAIARDGIRAHRVSVLPQPLSVFRWKALAQTENAVYQAFFTLRNEAPLHFTKFENASDAFVARALATREVQWYLTFARHPWVRSIPSGEEHIVELSDLQFTLDQELINALGASERQLPFIMRLVFSRDGELLRSAFSENVIFRAKTSKDSP